MANYPKKMNDPTEAALSAIQEALNVRDDDGGAAIRSSGAVDPLETADGAVDGRRRGARAAPTIDDGLFHEDDVAPREGLRLAANDDQQSIGQILHALQRRPARTSYMVAGLFSAAWVIGCLALSWAYLADLHTLIGAGQSRTALMVGLSAAALLPIIFFFGVAHMASRSQELRLIAQSMAQVAMRLAEPESVARDSIVTVGQAIRREVAAMGDGVERALARAGELETLVQNEVAALERTYNDNEVRIRGLLQELASQRDTLVGQAEQVRSAINNVHIDLTQDLTTISDLVGQQVNEAAQRITHSLAEKGEHITLALGHVGDNMIQQLGERGGDMLERLETAADETSRAIAGASERLTASLNFKTDHINEEFAEIALSLEHMMTSRLDRVSEGFSEKSVAIVDMMVGRSQELTDLLTSRSQQLTDTIVDTSSRLAETIAVRADEVNSTLKTSGESLILDLNLRGGDVVTKLEQTGARITDAIVSRGTKVTDTFRESAEHLADTVATRGDAVKEMLATRLAGFEEMFNHSGAELGEKISRDSATLGNLITRHLAEFDRTVKTYGSELVERLGARTQDVTESMRNYVDNFDTRVTSKSNEIAGSLDTRLIRFQEALDSRTQTLNEALSTRVMDIAKTLAEGGKEVVTALDKRIADVTGVINVRGAKLAETVGEKIADIDKALGARALEVSNNLDTRIGQFEQLLVGRAETVAVQIEARSRAAADLLNSRMEELTDSIKTNAGGAERALAQLAVSTVDALGKSAASSSELINRSTSAATEALNRGAAEVTVSLSRSAGALSDAISKSTGAATDAIGKSTVAATDAIGKTASATTDMLGKSAVAASEAIGRSAQEAERSLSTLSSGVTNVIKQNAADVERTLLGVSAEVARNFVGKADEINAAVSQRAGDMTRILDEKSSGLLSALAIKSQEFSGEVGRVTDHAVKSIEAKGFAFTQTMMDNSEEIARLINESSQNATTSMTRTLRQLQEGTQGVTEAAKTTIIRTLEDLQNATRNSVEQSKQTASATVAEMLETHGMLRSDTTALFERLREANILLQEVLSGAHENMTSLEHTMVTRVSEFVSTMNDVSSKSGSATARVEEQIGQFNNVTAKVLQDLGDLAGQFDIQGRSLAEAVELMEKSNRRTEDTMSDRKATMDTLVSTLDMRTEDFDQRLRRFSSLLEEALDAATGRAREIARIVAETSNESVQTMSQQFELVRTTSEEERRRNSEALRKVYDQSAGEAHGMFRQSAERFAEIMQGMKSMAAEMQRELEMTRAEMRRGILELPQETADSTAQMRRVIVDQIEALAELNRIVARHGRGLDTADPIRREAEPAPRRMPEPAFVAASNGSRADIPPPAPPPPRAPVRSDITETPRPAIRGDITGAPPRRQDSPSLLPSQNGNGRSGWLSDLLTRASRDEAAPAPAPAPQPREAQRNEAPRNDERAPRDSIESLDSLSVDIARMIDHEAAAELWERYKRGERNVFTRRLYTLQGQKAFDEIRKKYRGDAEFHQTVDRYVQEFERLLDEVSRGDRGQIVARTYLTSETGKVYTMLAHAAGRFDS
jgi:hypothetical protein